MVLGSLKRSGILWIFVSASQQINYEKEVTENRNESRRKMNDRVPTCFYRIETFTLEARKWLDRSLLTFFLRLFFVTFQILRPCYFVHTLSERHEEWSTWLTSFSYVCEDPRRNNFLLRINWNKAFFASLMGGRYSKSHSFQSYFRQCVLRVIWVNVCIPKSLIQFSCEHCLLCTRETEEYIWSGQLKLSVYIL